MIRRRFCITEEAKWKSPYTYVSMLGNKTLYYCDRCRTMLDLPITLEDYVKEVLDIMEDEKK